MKQAIAVASTCIVIGLVVTGLSDAAGSSFLSGFLDQNLLLVLIALMAINTTTVSVILTKMKEIADASPDSDFSATRHSMKVSTVEQMVLIVVAVVLQVAKSSPWLLLRWDNFEFVINSLLVAVFAYSMQVLYDTAQGVYVILDHEG